MRKLSSTLLFLFLIIPPFSLAAPPRSTLTNRNQTPRPSRRALVSLLRKKIKYLFVIYQENRSFDSYFGTFPGAEGLYSHPASKTPGFYQKLEDASSKTITVQPYRIGPNEGAYDLGSVGHSHPLTLKKMDIVRGKAQMDRFALAEEADHTRKGELPTLKAMQYGELEMAHEDGDTIPFLWRYASRFVLCDHIFEEMAADSTPGNLCIIGAQSGITQWLLHPDEAFKKNGGGSPGLPVVNDANPYWGSLFDSASSGKMPYNPNDLRKQNINKKSVQRNLTFATLMLSLNRGDTESIARKDRDPGEDLRDTRSDIAKLARTGGRAWNWGWYQEGFDTEPTDGKDPVDADGLHVSYVTHHNGPQYFGYISNNPRMAAHLHGLNDFFHSVRNRRLPGPGLYYIKGGKRNLKNLTPINPILRKENRFLGDDDHPGDSDSLISESLVARTVNAIAASPYWKESAIVITWDDSEGDYDHVPPPIRTFGPDGKPLSDGPRIPLLVISPYARTHAILHDQGDTASVVKLADTLFALTPLADLPDERRARVIGKKKFDLQNGGPFDDLTSGVTDLLGAFDPARLAGKVEPIPASYALIPAKLVNNLEMQANLGWRWAGSEPTDIRLGIKNDIPPQFNPRP